MSRKERKEVKCNGFTIVAVQATWSGCPQLLITAEVDGEVVDKGYLAPFRGYSFQISGNKSGENDKGSTPVFGLDSFNHFYQSGCTNIKEQTMVKYFMSCVCKDCVIEFAKGQWHNAAEDGAGHHPTYYRLKGFEYKKRYSELSEFDKFIEMSYRFIKEGCKYTDSDTVPMWALELILPEEV